ncbi:MAG: hypothetical protein ABJC04_02375 [Verrucomicrobiota bacterium]
MKILLFVIFSALSVAHGEVKFHVSIKPLPAEFQPLETTIRTHLIAAGEEWVRHFQTRDCTIEIEFSIREWPSRGGGRSFVAVPLRGERYEGKFVSEEGAAYKIRTGEDANGDAPDIEMFFDPAYFRTFWFDPDPKARTASLPDRNQGKLDADTVFLHELGHAFGFNGFRDQKNGILRGEYFSAYDRWVTFDGTNFFFNGPTVKKLYGKPVLLAHVNNNYHHVGDKEDTTDPKLAEDMMNGIVFDWSHRYYVTPLDIAMLTDCGLVPQKTKTDKTPDNVPDAAGPNSDPASSAKQKS